MAGTKTKDSYWSGTASRYAALLPPLSVSSSEQTIYEKLAAQWSPGARAAPRVLVLGATPDFYHLPWPGGTDLLAADVSAGMLSAVWPGNEQQSLYRDWRTMDLPDASRDRLESISWRDEEWESMQAYEGLQDVYHFHSVEQVAGIFSSSTGRFSLEANVTPAGPCHEYLRILSFRPPRLIRFAACHAESSFPVKLLESLQLTGPGRYFDRPHMAQTLQLDDAELRAVKNEARPIVHGLTLWFQWAGVPDMSLPAESSAPSHTQTADPAGLAALWLGRIALLLQRSARALQQFPSPAAGLDYLLAAGAPVARADYATQKPDGTRYRFLCAGQQLLGVVNADGREVTDSRHPSWLEFVAGIAQELEVGVLETARGAVLNSGFVFDRSNVAVCTNVTEEHLFEYGIETGEQMSEVKRLIVARARVAAVLNFDDEHCRRIGENLPVPRICWTSTRHGNDAIAGSGRWYGMGRVPEQRKYGAADSGQRPALQL